MSLTKERKPSVLSKEPEWHQFSFHLPVFILNWMLCLFPCQCPVLWQGLKWPHAAQWPPSIWNPKTHFSCPDTRKITFKLNAFLIGNLKKLSSTWSLTCCLFGFDTNKADGSKQVYIHVCVNRGLKGWIVGHQGYLHRSRGVSIHYSASFMQRFWFCSTKTWRKSKLFICTHC